MAGRLLYLDTSYVHECLFGHDIIRTEFLKRCKDNDVSSSYYVRAEIYKGLIKNIVSFYFIFKHPQQNTIKDAYAIWSHEFSKRKVADVANFLQCILEKKQKIEDNSLSKEARVFELRCEVNLLIKQVSFILDSFVENKMFCDKSKVAGSISGGLTDEDLRDLAKELDSKEKVSCNANKILKSYSGVIAKICSEENKKQLKELKDRINHFEEKVKTFCNKESCVVCSHLGDFFISVECPKSHLLLATDKSFEIYGKALQKSYEILDGTPSLKAKINKELYSTCT